MRMACIFLLVVGVAWALFVTRMFLVLAGTAGPPVSWLLLLLYWGSALVGPVVLVAGSSIVLRGGSGRSGIILVSIGCLIFNGYILYSTVVGVQRQPLEAPPPYKILVLLIFIMGLTDLAGIKVLRQLVRSRSDTH